jgi:hypothetical protein
MSVMFEKMGHQFRFKSSHTERTYEGEAFKVLFLSKIICEFWTSEKTHVYSHKRETAQLLLLPKGLLRSRLSFSSHWKNSHERETV